jgi:small subunit ribosomal protein S9
MANLVQYYGTGRRKSAIARVFLRPGTGAFTVNKKAHDVYFVTEQQRIAAKRPLTLTELTGNFDVITTVRGGGVCAQARWVSAAPCLSSTPNCVRRSRPKAC